MREGLGAGSLGLEVDEDENVVGGGVESGELGSFGGDVRLVSQVRGEVHWIQRSAERSETTAKQPEG
jgi:hypothetical protein